MYEISLKLDEGQFYSGKHQSTCETSVQEVAKHILIYFHPHELFVSDLKVMHPIACTHTVHTHIHNRTCHKFSTYAINHKGRKSKTCLLLNPGRSKQLYNNTEWHQECDYDQELS